MNKNEKNNQKLYNNKNVFALNMNLHIYIYLFIYNKCKNCVYKTLQKSNQNNYKQTNCKYIIQKINM